MSNLTPEDALAAADALTNLRELADGFHPEHPLAKEAFLMQAQVLVVQTYLIGYAKAHAKGLRETDAIIATLEGKEQFSPEAQEAGERARTSGLQ